MKTKTVYVLRVSHGGARIAYTREGFALNSQNIDPKSGGGWVECLKCDRTVPTDQNYIVMKNARSVKWEWQDHVAGSVCVDCVKTADEHGRIFIPVEEVQA